jgi:hypothetical protein
MRARSGVAAGLFLWLALGAHPALGQGETVELQLDATQFERGLGEAVVLSGVVYAHAAPANGSGLPPPVPHAGAQVRVSFVEPGLATGYTATTDDNGLFAITLPGRDSVGTYRLAVVAESDIYGETSPTQEVLWVVTAPPGATGQPLPGFDVLAAVGAAVVAGASGFARARGATTRRD